MISEASLEIHWIVELDEYGTETCFRVLTHHENGTLLLDFSGGHAETLAALNTFLLSDNPWQEPINPIQPLEPR